MNRNFICMANHLNRPSIFEIATAFNNGTPPQHDGYEKTYYSLSELLNKVINAANNGKLYMLK